MLIPINSGESARDRHGRMDQGRQRRHYNAYHPYGRQGRRHQMNSREDSAWDEENAAVESHADSDPSSYKDIFQETGMDEAEAWDDVSEESNSEKEDGAPVQTLTDFKAASVLNEGVLETWEERYVRLRADFDNYKRHTEEEKKHRVALGKEAVLDDIFPLVEHMERALKAFREEDDGSAILKGVEMVYSELLSVLEKHGVDRIETIGQPFDPNIHEALAVTPYSDCPDNTIVEEIRAGFMKSGKLLRPASVVVAKGGMDEKI